jgi:tetratricopeptide (TPR) repeat protein
MERNRSRSLTCRQMCRIVSIVLVGMLGFGCDRGKASFSGLLARIDSAPESASPENFKRAAKLADSTEERLRILKRASLRNPQIYADTARTLLANGAVAGPVLMAIIDALIEAGAYDEALSLFDGKMEPGDFKAAYAEVLVHCIKSGTLPTITMERAVLCTDATGDIRWMLNAAIDAMVAGDTGTASLLLLDIEKKGYAIPYSLLWDAGLLSVLADRMPQTSDPLELAVSADSACLIGRKATAAYLYTTLLDQYPDWSWKPYAALARQTMEPDEQVLLKWPHIPLEGSWELLSTPGKMSESMYRMLEEKFPDSIGASIERARWLYGKGRISEASMLISGEDAQSAAARLRIAPRDRIVPMAFSSVALYPESGLIKDIALEMLASIGAWADFRHLIAVDDGIRQKVPRMWFWQAVLKALDGDPAGAAMDIRTHGAESAGYAGILDIAMLELASDNPVKAKEAALVALSSSNDAEERSTAYIMLGDAEYAAGSLKEARLAFDAALSADPESRVARSRIQRLPNP